ncbi:MAG TPA: type II secretion system protein N [Cellvibrionaceae bacterium]
MKISKPLVVSALVVYFLFLVISSTPATLVSSLLKKAIPNLVLSSVSGTAWSGRALGAELNLDGVPLKFGPLNWQLSPFKLFLLKGCADIKSEKLSGGFCRSVTGNNQLNKVKLELPAGLASTYLREAGASVDGTLFLQMDNAVFTNRLQIDAMKGRATWAGAKVSANGMAFALGDYAADLSADQGALKAHLKDESGPIKVNLDAWLRPGSVPKVTGEIQPLEHAPEAIGDALSLFAEKNDAGIYKVNYPIGG